MVTISRSNIIFKGRLIKECGVCGKEFVATKMSFKYCCRRCERVASRRREAEKKKKEKENAESLRNSEKKQPKYMIPLIIYFPLLFVGYFVIDLFHTEKAEIPDGLATTEYLTPDLPDAKMKGDGIGNKYESMLKSYGKIDDYSALGNITVR